ncbi:MAG TPA: STAS domain-containing protein [Acidimicrobiales bacterium]|nr:STAS domain-containing protein [Acidimicrobiales bacterium]
MIAPSPQPVAATGEAATDLLRTGFHIEHENLGRTVVLRLHGELDMATARALRAALLQAMSVDGTPVALDLSGLSFIDSTGIAVLLAAGRRALDEERSFSLHHPGRMVGKALQLTGADRLIAIEAAEATG